MISVQLKATVPKSESNIVSEIIRNLPSHPSGLKELSSTIEVDGRISRSRVIFHSEDNTNFLYVTIGENHCKFFEDGKVVSFNLAGDTLPDITTEFRINRILAQAFDCVVNRRDDGNKFIKSFLRDNIFDVPPTRNFESN